MLAAGSVVEPAHGRPADRTPPRVAGPSPRAVYFSPNGDRVRDVAPVVVRVSEAGRLTALVVDRRGRAVARLATNRRIARGVVRLSWNGRAGRRRRPDGRYTLRVYVRDLAGNKSRRWPATAYLVIDTRRPSVKRGSVGPTPFSPNGDRRKDTTAMRVVGNEALSGTLRVLDGANKTIRRRSVVGGRSLAVIWDGKDDRRRRVGEGAYKMRFFPRDRAGNPARYLQADVGVDLTPPRLTLGLSETTLTPDGDGSGDKVHIEMDLGSPAVALSRSLTSPSGRVLGTYRATQVPPGSYDTTFDGMFNADGSVDGSRETSYPTGGYRVTAVAEDEAGNRVRHVRTVRIDSWTLVMLDPGHGGLVNGKYDTGAVGFKTKTLPLLYESVVNLQMARGRTEGTRTVQKGVVHFLRESTSTGQEIRVRLTRSREREPGLTLDRRAHIANYYAPSVFMSIHNNDSSNSKAIGTETLYVPSSVRGKYLAQRVQYRVARAVRATRMNSGWRDRGLKDGSWLRLARLVKVPMALVEGGFVNNPVENKLLRMDRYREAVARGVAEGIEDYLVHARAKGWSWW